MIRQFLLIASLATMAAGCSSKHDAPNPEEAQAALQASVDEDVRAAQLPPAHIVAVQLGMCIESAGHPIFKCPTQITINGETIARTVEFWRTPHLAHPW
ncbi:MAG: hypothetical protein ABI205_09325, partial [Gemmatimonadaceae bacterium]